MKEKFININGLEIFYYDNEKQGQTMLFIHGNSMNSTLFYHQLESRQLKDFRLIALDLPGHGKSSKSKNPEKNYAVSNYINVVVDFIEKLDLKDLVIFGHSLGGHIAIHVSGRIKKDNLKGLIIMGTPPLTNPPKLEEAFLPNPALGLMFNPDLSEQELQILTNALIKENCNEYNKIKESLSICDPAVRPFIGKSIANEIDQDESQILKGADATLAILHGENDQLVNPGYIRNLQLSLWQDQIIIIKKSTHSAFLENPAHFNKIVLDFILDLK